MPSQMSGLNGTNNRYHLNKIINYSIIENNNGADQFRSPDVVQMKTDCVAMNNNLSSSINMLEQGMAELYTFSVPITSSNLGMIDEYRLRLGSEDLGHQRPVSCLRRSSMIDRDCDSVGTTYLSFNRVLSDNVPLWSPEGIDESRLRELCAKDAHQAGFIVGDELEVVKAKSHRSVIQTTPDRIISSFKDRYGQSDSTSKKTYLQLGVRVPTKEHVSEIVGKQGSKIKQIREKTGALITTPGEQEDHVFIIEAPPRTALHVAQILKSRAEDITMSRTQESRRRSSCPTNNGVRHNNKSPAIAGFNQSNSKVVLSSGRIQVPKIIVGRIIGTQGSIITTIQRDTGTEIRSPPKEIGKPKHAMADFEILVYQTANMTDVHEAKQRILNAKQLIAHVAMHQLEKIRAEEAPYSNYQVQPSSSLLNSNGNEVPDDDVISRRRINHLVSDDGSVSLQGCVGVGGNKEQLLSDQMRPFDWIWSDVDKLDDFLAHEVVDRILEESKKKTKTRSEPSIYDSSGTNLFTLGESDSYSNGSSEISRPRHSLPETRIGAISGIGLDSFYRSSLQSNLPYTVNDNFLLPDGDSDYRSSPSVSFVNRRDPGSRSDLSEQEILDFQSHDFIDNRTFTNGNQFSKPREICEQTLLQHMYLNNGDLTGTGIDHRNFNRFSLDPNFSNGNFSKLDGLSTTSNAPSYYSFPVDNSHWNYSCPSSNQINPHNCLSSNQMGSNNCHLTHQMSTNNGPMTTQLSANSYSLSNQMNFNNNQQMDSAINMSLTKSYADSVKPLANLIGSPFSTTHGTIGDHLKKSITNHYKG